jgi:hypothetical protein
MLSNYTQSTHTAEVYRVGSSREIEFADALNGYMTSYVADHRRRLQRPLGALGLRIAERLLAALIIGALRWLGSAMSGGTLPRSGVTQ